MKQIFTLLLMSFVVAAQAQFEMGFHYMLSEPTGTLGENIQPAHSFAMSGTSRLNSNRQFFIGAEVAFGSYANKTQPQTYISPEDGISTHTDVIFSSNIQNYHAIAGYEFSNCTTFKPYVTMKVGASRFNTSILIEDPEDQDGCSPLEEESLFGDVAFSGGAGAGLKIDASTIFRKADKGSWWFDLSANYLWGTSLDYVNVKYLNPAEPGPNSFSRPVDVTFVHLQSHHTHEHQAAEMYTSGIQSFDFKIGVVKTFGECRY